MRHFDVLIVGSGLAGMTLALHLAETRTVGLITKKNLLEASSSYAQGGIAAVLDTEDSVEAHIQDTLVAGAGLCNADTTRFIVENSRAAIDWLIALGVPFTRDASTAIPPKTTSGYQGFHLTREGGHSHRRIIHAADATGEAVTRTLGQKICAHPNITVLEDYLGIDLITAEKLGLAGKACFGIYALDKTQDEVVTLTAGHTILATGGAGKVYLYTTNPDTATGDGIAMGWRAGCRVANMEFIQFHPTCLYHPHAKSFLVSEAVRGEGGILRLPDGTRFMPDHDPRAELAPRDVVARAIDFEMKKHGLDCVYLDISYKPESFIRSHFPNIYATCLALGIDISKEPIPVVPAAHYTCGGLVTDLDGRTDVDRLFAVGEASCTGLHGANRLASNSLLECMVIGRATAAAILTEPPLVIPPIPDWDDSRVTDPDEEVVISHNWDELRRAMWDYVGIVRTNKRLARALHRIELLKGEINEYYQHFHISNDLIELRNLVQTSELIVRSALARQESRGLHYSRDYPDLLPEAKDTVLYPVAATMDAGTADGTA